MPDLHAGLNSDETLRAQLLARWPELADDPETLQDSLDGISSFPEMIAAVIRSAREDEMTATKLGDMIEAMQARKRRLIDRAGRKKALALHFCEAGRRTRITAPDFTATVKPGRGKVIITDENALDMKWLRVKTEPNKDAIGEALRNGERIEGATLSNPQPIIMVRAG